MKPAPEAVLALAGASLASFAAAALDGHFAYAASGGAAGARLPLYVVDLGVVFPVAAVVAALTALASRAVFPGGVLGRRLPSPPSRDGRRRARQVIVLAATPVASLFGVVTLAHASRRLLAAGAPAALTGVAVAAAACGVALTAGAAVAVLAARPALARRVATVPPVLAIGVATLVVGVLLAVGIASGTTNGDGGFLGILGVLRRDELDLRGVVLVLLLFVAALFGPEALRRVTLPATAAATALPLAAFVFAASSGLESRPRALALERGAPLGGRALAVLRRATDRDHDGASALFGGGDCADGDPRRSPAADDLPGNGVDEDCSGRDEAPSAPEPAATPSAPASEPAAVLPRDLSVVLVTVDTLRADLGYAGNPRPVSPNIDALAARSVIFERAYSLASYTGKSLGPMLIGKYPSETRRSYHHFDRFGKDESFVQERLKAAGVRTLSAQGHWYFTPEYGLGRGFDELDQSAAPRVPQMEGDRTVNGAALTDAAIALLSKPENTGGRFYLWVHYLDPHAEYVRQKDYDFGTKGRQLYDGEVAYEDAQVGRLLDFVTKSAFAGRTAIVFTSDHGEAFGEHGMMRHGFEVWEELVRVPLLVHVPGLPARRVSEPRGAVDFVPTLLELFGVEVPARSGEDFVSGVSLLRDVVQPEGYRPEARPVFIDMCEGPYNAERQALIESGTKLIASNGLPIGLYDLAADPGEKKDLLGDAARAEAAVARFKAFRRGLRAVPARK